MPVDTSIYSNIKPAPVMSLADVVNFQQGLDRGDILKLQLQEGQQAAQRQHALREAASRPGAYNEQGTATPQLLRDLASSGNVEAHAQAVTQANAAQTAKLAQEKHRADLLKAHGEAVNKGMGEAVIAYENALKQPGGNHEIAMSAMQRQWDATLDRWGKTGEVGKELYDLAPRQAHIGGFRAQAQAINQFFQEEAARARGVETGERQEQHDIRMASRQEQHDIRLADRAQKHTEKMHEPWTTIGKIQADVNRGHIKPEAGEQAYRSYVETENRKIKAAHMAEWEHEHPFYAKAQSPTMAGGQSYQEWSKTHPVPYGTSESGEPIPRPGEPMPKFGGPAAAKDAPVTPQAQQAQGVVTRPGTSDKTHVPNKVYKDKAGNRSQYLGNGQWRDL